MRRPTPARDTRGTPCAPGQHVEPRLGRVRLGALADDPGIIVRFDEDLRRARLAISARRASLALLRSVLRRGRRRYPRTLTVDVSGLFRVPTYKRRRLFRAADPIAVERIIEAVLNRPRRDPLAPIRDAALVAAMGFTVAARPSEWLASVTWTDVGEHAAEIATCIAHATRHRTSSTAIMGRATAFACQEHSRGRRRMGLWRLDWRAQRPRRPYGELAHRKIHAPRTNG
jgi:hypothetical protein